MRTGDAFTLGIISPPAMDLGLQLLRRLHLDWDELGYDDEALTGLVEFMLRLIQSLVLTPGSARGTARDGEDLRAFLRRWFAPTIRAHGTDASGR